MPLLPLPDVGTDDMDDLILHRWNHLPEALKFYLDYAPHYDAWPSILEAERQEQIASYEGPFIPSGVKNCAGRWRFWEGQTIESVIADCKAFRNPRLHQPYPPAALTRACLRSPERAPPARPRIDSTEVMPQPPAPPRIGRSPPAPTSYVYIDLTGGEE